MPSYIAKTGSEAKERLAIQHRVFSPGTQTLLHMAQFRPNMQVLVVGCGCGDETIMIAQQLNEHGKVVALDKEAAQIEQVKQAAQQASVTERIQYLTKPLEMLTEKDGQYDLIVCRFVIPHLADPKKAIELLKARLLPQGVLASQEPIVSSCRSEPKSPALTYYLSLMQQFAECNQLDFDMAQKIPSLFEACGLTTKTQSWQPTVFQERDKRMVSLSAKECMPAILKHNLISPDQAEQLIKDLDAEVTRPNNTVLFQCCNVLTVGVNNHEQTRDLFSAQDFSK